MSRKLVGVILQFDHGADEVHDIIESGCHRSFNTFVEDSNVSGKIVETFQSHSVTWIEGRVTRN